MDKRIVIPINRRHLHKLVETQLKKRYQNKVITYSPTLPVGNYHAVFERPVLVHRMVRRGDKYWFFCTYSEGRQITRIHICAEAVRQDVRGFFKQYFNITTLPPLFILNRPPRKFLWWYY